MKIFEKKFSLDFPHQARTLDPFVVSDVKYADGEHELTHDNDWTVKAVIHEDYYYWINDFKANHPKFGRVWGNFEDIVYADSEDGYNEFLKEFPYTEWDYWDI
jgi:hypothetical protein